MTLRLLRHATWFLAAVVLLASSPTAAQGATLLTLKAAEEQLLPPHDRLRKVNFTPTSTDRTLIESALGYTLAREKYTWRVAERNGETVGYLLFDNELGKHEPITFAVALDADGAVSNVAVCVYREIRGDEIKRTSFMKQFFGKRHGDSLRLRKDITHVSGATISSRSACRVVARALALWHAAYGQQAA